MTDANNTGNNSNNIVVLKANGKPLRARDKRRLERERVNALAQAADEEWQKSKPLTAEELVELGFVPFT